MKNIMLFIFIVNCYLCLAQSYKVNFIKPYVFNGEECISYLVEASNNDSLFFILSDVDKSIEPNDKILIEKGGNYDFKLRKVYPLKDSQLMVKDSFMGHAIIPNSPPTECYSMTSDSVHHNSIYKSKNTNGEYFIINNSRKDTIVPLK